MTASPETTATPTDSGYADGLHLYYEQYGEGPPLVLLHGGMLTIDLNFRHVDPDIGQVAHRHRGGATRSWADR